MQTVVELGEKSAERLCDASIEGTCLCFLTLKWAFGRWLRLIVRRLPATETLAAWLTLPVYP
jgi:hypothetical protein